MKRRFKKVDYEQALDLTVRLGDCLPPEHLARFVVDSVAQFDLSALYARYGPRGGEPYATGVFSSRKIERATYEAAPFRILGIVGNGGTFPHHSVTISDSVRSATVVHSGAAARDMKNMHSGLVTAMTVALFSPTSC
jgi:hypothetical protein